METKWKPLERTGGKAEMESDISAPEVAPVHILSASMAENPWEKPRGRSRGKNPLAETAGKNPWMPLATPG